MSYKEDLSKNIFYLQSHYKMTTTFVENNFFFLLEQVRFIHTQNMYTLFQEISAHICLLYFDVKPISQNLQETTCARASFLLKLHEKETAAQLFSCEICETFKNIFLQNTPPGVGHGMRIVRDVLTLLLMMDFKEC